MYAYIDESGQSGYSKKSSKYFVLACIIFDNENIAPRIAKSIFKKFKLGKHKKNQIHATDESDRLKIKILSEIRNHNYIFEYENVLKKDFKKDYYLELCEKLFLKLSKHKIDKVYIASKDTRKVTLNKINELALKNNLKIFLARPEKEKGLQVADFISWSIFQHYEKNRSEFFDLLKK